MVPNVGRIGGEKESDGVEVARRCLARPAQKHFGSSHKYREGVVKAWTVRRRPEAERWDADLIANLKGSPQRWSEDEPGDERPVAVSLNAPDDEEHDELPQKEREKEKPYI